MRWMAVRSSRLMDIQEIISVLLSFLQVCCFHSIAIMVLLNFTTILGSMTHIIYRFSCFLREKILNKPPFYNNWKF